MLKARYKTLLEKRETLTIRDADTEVAAFNIAEILRSTDKNVVFITQNKEMARPLTELKNLHSASISHEILSFANTMGDLTPFEPELNKNIIACKNLVINKILEGSKTCLIAGPQDLLIKTIPHGVLQQEKIVLEVNKKIGYSGFIDKLQQIGFEMTDSVYTVGEMARRGGIVDIGYIELKDGQVVECGYRVEFAGDAIETIKAFDFESQISKTSEYLRHSKRLEISPVSNIILNNNTIDAFKKKYPHFTQYEAKVLEQVSGGLRPLNIENLLPAFYSTLGRIGDCFELDNWIVVLDFGMQGVMQNYLADIASCSLRLGIEANDYYINKQELGVILNSMTKVLLEYL